MPVVLKPKQSSESSEFFLIVRSVLQPRSADAVGVRTRAWLEPSHTLNCEVECWMVMNDLVFAQQPTNFSDGIGDGIVEFIAYPRMTNTKQQCSKMFPAKKSLTIEWE